MRLDAKHSLTKLPNPTCSVPSFVLVMNMTSGSGQLKEEEEAPQDSSIEKACVQRDDIIKHDRNLWNDPTYMPYKRLRWKARKAFAEEKARKARALNRLQTTVGKLHAACSAESFEVADLTSEKAAALDKARAARNAAQNQAGSATRDSE